MTTKPTAGQAVHGGQPMNPGSQPMNPAGQPMNPGGMPMNPVGMPAYPRGPAPSTAGGRFKRFLFNIFLVVVAFGGGYLYMERESQRDRDAMERAQEAAQERIAALEQRIDDLGRESGTRVELDLTQIFEPIREALSQVTLVKLSEISEQITKELVRVVESDLAVDLTALGAAAGAPQEGAEEVAGLAPEEAADDAGDPAASEPPAQEPAAPERAEAPASEPSTQLPPEPGDGAERVSSGAAAPEVPTAGPDVSVNSPAAAEPQPEEAPVSDVVALLAQYAAPAAEEIIEAPVAAATTDGFAAWEADVTLSAFGFDSTAGLARN